MYKEVLRRYREELEALLIPEGLSILIPRPNPLVAAAVNELGVGKTVDLGSRRGKVRKKRRVESD